MTARLGVVLLSELEHFLARSERAIALLERCQPLNAPAELARLGKAWASGNACEPAFDYAPAPSLAPLMQALERACVVLEQGDALGRLYAGRALELLEEAEIVTALGSAEFKAKAARRFPLESSPEHEKARAWARDWMLQGASARASDGEPPDRELLSDLMAREIGRLRLPFRIVERANLSCLAATGENVIFVQRTARPERLEAERVVLHEVYGHALPRWCAQKQSVGLFRIGAYRGSDDEEGRALLLEWRYGYLNTARRAELGYRHTAAVAVREGADYVETVRLLLERGGALDPMLRVAARVYRGGGLGRELVYVPALARVSAAVHADATLEPWLSAGRLSVSAAAVVRSLGLPLTEVERPRMELRTRSIAPSTLYSESSVTTGM